MLGVRLSLLRHYRSHVETKLRKGKCVHVLLVDPNGNACMTVAARNPGTLQPERDQANIKASLDDSLCVYNSETTPPYNLECRAEEKMVC